MFKEGTAVYIYILLKKSAGLLRHYFLEILLASYQYFEKKEYPLFSNNLKSFAREFDKSYIYAIYSSFLFKVVLKQQQVHHLSYTLFLTENIESLFFFSFLHEECPTLFLPRFELIIIWLFRNHWNIYHFVGTVVHWLGVFHKIILFSPQLLQVLLWMYHSLSSRNYYLRALQATQL